MPPSSEVVFEGDEAGRRIQGEAPSPVAHSSVVDFMLRHHLASTERRARWTVSLAALAALAVAAIFIRAELAPTVTGTSYGKLSPAERAALPAKQRTQLDQIEAERMERLSLPATANPSANQ